MATWLLGLVEARIGDTVCGAVAAAGALGASVSEDVSAACVVWVCRM